jgi:hypothetical protein
MADAAITIHIGNSGVMSNRVQYHPQKREKQFELRFTKINAGEELHSKCYKIKTLA